ncbi:MAG: C40 family peptidase [Muribaculaceae bacterium]
MERTDAETNAMKRRWAHGAATMVAALLMCVMTSCHSSRRAVVSDDVYEPQVAEHEQQAPERELHDAFLRYGITREAGDNERLYAEVESWLGVPYRYGGNTRSGVDCSGLVVAIYKTVYGTLLQRSSAKILQENCHEIKKNDLREGDLVFFSTQKSRSRINHVGIYLKNGRFVHAGSAGVTIDVMDMNYYVTHYVASGRVKR